MGSPVYVRSRALRATLVEAFLETAFENQGPKGLARKGTGTLCIVMHYGMFKIKIAPLLLSGGGGFESTLMVWLVIIHWGLNHASCGKVSCLPLCSHHLRGVELDEAQPSPR